MEKNTMEYRVEMQHTEKSFEALAHMQYDLFCMGNRVSRSLLSMGLMLLGVVNFSQWWGILITAYASLTQDVTYEEVKAVYDAYYGKEQFVRVLEKDVCPQTRWVEGSNYVDVNFKIDPRTKRVIMMGAMDNVVKGAAGQAVQNMNLLFGLPENMGLKQIPLFP